MNDQNVGVDPKATSPVGADNGILTDDPSADADATATPQTAVDSETSELQAAKRELADLKDRYLRNMAEMDNMRKRLEREKADFIKFSGENILKDMIPILDSLDKAIPQTRDSASSEAAYWEGVVNVQKQLLAALGKHGLERLEALGKPFDPNFHQAIQRIESKDVTEETVAAEYAKGYVLNGRLLRAAMVSVQVPG